jgi:hypothetical protein
VLVPTLQHHPQLRHHQQPHMLRIRMLAYRFLPESTIYCLKWFLEQLAQTRNAGGILSTGATYNATFVDTFNNGYGGGSICNSSVDTKRIYTLKFVILAYLAAYEYIPSASCRCRSEATTNGATSSSAIGAIKVHASAKTFLLPWILCAPTKSSANCNTH